MNIKISVLMLMALLITGCSTSPYRAYSNGVGYSDTSLGKNKYEISYHGTSDQDETVAKQYAIVRAAEIGRQNNYSHFVVLRSNEKEKQQKEVLRVIENVREPYDPYFRHHRDIWNSPHEVRTYTTVSTRPMVKIIVEYYGSDCSDCLVVDDNIEEGIKRGIIKQ